ncbi:UNVERIFIED_CONTAM: Ankyrin repeat domain-containing protein 9 [Gekko kuhli]
MPWNVKWLSSYRGHDSASQKQCKKSSFAFYQAVRDQLPVWLLEDMRLMEAFHWQGGGKVRSYSPSEALLYALVHDHQPYAQHLLRSWSVLILVQFVR